MTVAQAKAIVKAKYPQAICTYCFNGEPIILSCRATKRNDSQILSDPSITFWMDSEAWKSAAERIEKEAQHD